MIRQATSKFLPKGNNIIKRIIQEIFPKLNYQVILKFLKPIIFSLFLEIAVNNFQPFESRHILKNMTYDISKDKNILIDFLSSIKKSNKMRELLEI